MEQMKKVIRYAISFYTIICLLIGLISCKQINNEKSSENDQQLIYIGEDIAVAPTTYGKVRGFIMRDIYHFRGIPYGASTERGNRFMPPQEPKPWKNIRPTVAFGASAPQTMYNQQPESYHMFQDHWNYDLINEDCLRLNIWTPSLDDQKRPVLVWLHGGGYSRGNGVEQDGYMGENFARKADIVFVSVNHRLNVFGFSDLSAVGGEKYKESGNVGILDIIAALKWVHNNIASFGGDPGNVTIMGQSGGGAKVCTIASMPAANGLIHKAVALSGSTIKASSKQQAQQFGRFLLKEAGLQASQIDSLQHMPWQEYMSIAESASKKMQKSMNLKVSFSPIGDDINIPDSLFFDPENPNIPDVPMLFCTTFHEWSISRDHPELEGINFAGVTEKLSTTYGVNSKVIVEAYQRQFPEMSPIEIWNLIKANRKNVVRSANRKLVQKSPVYMAWFGWKSPLFDGRQRAFHCIDISFWFYNTDLMITHSGGGKRPRLLSEKMCAALSSFMRTGNPSTPELPQWLPYTEENGETMILDNECKLVNDPDGPAREILVNCEYNQNEQTLRK
ncbi:MAG: carboxylesterase family protein [Bacteroides sp.]|uniref:carboxylesterase/lipase family protein n=1 Tax=Bacteroides sp. TaxID=29523 RepID=UPI0026E02C81|nr:carboxylesterase family protein [Bacteroides sp.]MDO5420307.1 carboxylesterase family protein [Bacteroides sp.]